MTTYRIISREQTKGCIKYRIEMRWLLFFWLPVDAFGKCYDNLSTKEDVFYWYKSIERAKRAIEDWEVAPRYASSSKEKVVLKVNR